MTIKLTTNGVFIVAIISSATALVDKFYFAAKDAPAKSESAIIFTSKDPQYDKRKHVDGNFDGIVTQFELDSAHNFIASTPDVMFVTNMSKLDRDVTFGLKIATARKALAKLSDLNKKELLALNDKDRVKLINKHFN